MDWGLYLLSCTSLEMGWKVISNNYTLIIEQMAITQSSRPCQSASL